MTLVSDYNPAWPSWFQRLRAVVAGKLGAACLAIEHVGSTAVPGMTAKPIIDVIVVVADGALSAAKRLLGELGYRHQRDLGIRGREAFEPTDQGLRSSLPAHHLCLCARESEELTRQVAFRDYLRAHPQWASRLSELKRSLCERCGADRQAYIAGKSAMVQEITRLAQQWAQGCAADRAGASQWRGKEGESGGGAVGA
jgi:GrpB-like predicted nucleotidyltransferase (UPF0157 family)